MKRATERQRLNAAIQQVEAMLFSASVENGMGKSGEPSKPTVWRQRDILKNLVHLADILDGKVEELPHCAACGKLIRSRQAYVHDVEDGLDFHARCMGISAKRAARITPAHYRREMVRRAAAARAFLRKKGVMVG